jgi:hypothetical protein
MENVENTHKDYWAAAQRINSFEMNIKTTAVGSEERQKLHGELDAIYEEIEAMQTGAMKTNGVVLPLLAQMREQIISLYGKVEEFFENHSVSCIAQEALHLSLLLTRGETAKAALLSARLKGKIQSFTDERLPSLHNRKILALAQKLSREAEEPEEGRTRIYHLQLTQLLKTLVEENLEKTRAFLYPEEAELAMELYEVAELYSRHEEQQAWQKLRTLLYKLPSLQVSQFSQRDLSPQEKAALLTQMADEITLGSEKLSPSPEQADSWRFVGTLV